MPILTPDLLENEIKRGKRWFVRQAYLRGMQPGLRATLMLRAYDSEAQETAAAHLAAIQNDKMAFVYDATLPEHLERLKVAANQPDGYKTFYIATNKIDWNLPAEYKEKIRHYILKHHSSWANSKKTIVELHEKYGELILKFIHDNKEKDLIPFDTIENY
ncbi:MAG TPA: hypothetical protein VGN00_20110 [Puia sp.]